MKIKPSIISVPEVVLLLETSTGFGRGLLGGIARYSRLNGPWSLYVASGHIDQALARHKSWGGGGIIARVRSPDMAKLILATKRPFVASFEEWGSYKLKGAKFGEIRSDSPEIARMGAAHLLGLGLCHFAFCGYVDCLYSLRREEAFTRYVQEQGFQCQRHQMKLPSWLQAPSWVADWETAQPILVEWLKSLPKPVGLMTCDDVCARQVLESCPTVKLRVPDDVAVVGVGNDELMCELCNPPLTSVAVDLDIVGYESARLLDRLMSGQLDGENCVYVRPVYVATRRSSEVITQNDPFLVIAMRFIRDHAGRAIGVQDVVDAAGVSRRTLERRFFGALGRSIASEIAQCRMVRAKRLLLETKLPSYRVAEGAGFGTVTTFNRVFRRATGASPRRFREKGGRLVSFQKESV